MYDPAVHYSKDDFRKLTTKELHILFDEARAASFRPVGFKLVRKITKDISSMRLILNGFDGIHNEAHR